MRKCIEDVLKGLEEYAKKLDENARAYKLCNMYGVRTKNGIFESDSPQQVRRMIDKKTTAIKREQRKGF